jgi:hypothetical protein
LSIESVTWNSACWILKAVREAFYVQPKTVAKQLQKTLKLLQGVLGYQSIAPIDPKFIADDVPPTAFETKFANAAKKPQLDH